MEQQGLFENRINLDNISQSLASMQSETGKIIIGQQKLIEQLLIAVLANGHVLIEGVPGLAKTLSAKIIAKLISADFTRIQFTPDLMPSDIVGTNVFNMSKANFEFNKGPVFSNIVLIDEINRAPAKTQSALFEVMEERQVTVDGKTYPMSEPFLVFATQNPIEHEGTYRLPEAQLDRFMFKIKVEYPTLEQEKMILQAQHERKEKKQLQDMKPVVSGKSIVEYQQLVPHIHIEEKLMQYIAQIVNSTRMNNAIYLGASPRASINMMIASKACAICRGRDFVTPDDIKEIAFPVLNHRIILTPEKEMEGATVEDVLRQILQTIEIPR